MMRYFVTAIGTDSGKTLVSAILVEALSADYWKPIQAGIPTDTDRVRQLASSQVTCHPEAYFLKTPASPHAAAKIEGKNISLELVQLPGTTNSLVVEGAGGVMVPINDNDLVIDIAKKLDCEIVLVCNLYLGSINHSLLTLEYLKNHGYKLKGIVFNGEPNPESERIILKYANLPCLLRIPREDAIDSALISKYATQLKNQWK